MNGEAIILVVRSLIALTFLILAIGGPVANHKLNKFIKLYVHRHAELAERVIQVEKRIQVLEDGNDGH